MPFFYLGECSIWLGLPVSGCMLQVWLQLRWKVQGLPMQKDRRSILQKDRTPG